ncbi:putative ATP-dependent DEAD/H RNA helicase [Trypanosoma cruzi]|uniref:Putative ATP-dependent DEAD/H RNA helicase n=1 Tax=Trypanosoma cruzi TaxID=5693 RepID=A0A2V2UIK9_TRYCR|nr:putative ATP-dependent DEAD/H RNA helicase [Trypanosoma cruzi]
MFADFASGRTNILCATDLAARGLDVHVDVVVNFHMPTNALVYLSRAGRTARQGRLGRVYSLYTKHQGVIVSAVRAFLKKNIPLEGVSNSKSHMMNPRYAEWRTHKMNAIARSYVSLITQKTIPAHLERTYLHHNATWRPLFHPQTTGIHAGVPPRQQQRVMNAVTEQAVWFRRGNLQDERVVVQNLVDATRSAVYGTALAALQTVG